jgi:P27 family predicted phage terminase small subunit
MGRPRKPTNLKVLEGNPGKRPLPVNEPKPVPIAPPCPAHLDSRAKKEWKRIAPELEQLGLLTRIDMAALAAYCQSYGWWAEAGAQIKKHGMLVKNQKGFPVVTPYVAIACKFLEQMKSYLIEFGLAPSSRSKIEVKPPAEDEDPMEKLLRKAGRQNVRSGKS